MTWLLFLVVVPDEWVVGGLGVAFAALGAAIRTLYRDLREKGIRTGQIIEGLTRAVEQLTSELRKR